MIKKHILTIALFLVCINIRWCADDVEAKVSKDVLDSKESTFDEIQYINKAYETERFHPLAKHIVQGDIMTKDGDQAVSADKRMTIKDDLRLWRKRKIPYIIASELNTVNTRIKLALDEIGQATCLKFSERTKEENFIRFVKKIGCYSPMGMQGGGQEISIGTFCDRKEIIQHLVLHALGMFHENSRQDRNDYIKINWENIKPEQQINFRVGKSGMLNTEGLPYDINSLMHYGRTAFGDGLITSESIKDSNEPLGNKIGLTNGDVQQLDLLYRCKSIPDAGYGPLKVWSDCEYKVKRLYRICYGGECEPPNNNGIQHIRMTCDESEQAAMKGCFVHKPSSPSFLQLQEFASKEACAQLHNAQPFARPINFISSMSFLECMRRAQKNGYRVFGISEFCKCHYGDDDVNIADNGDSGDCGDAGHGTTKDAIFMYKIIKT